MHNDNDITLQNPVTIPSMDFHIGFVQVDTHRLWAVGWSGPAMFSTNKGYAAINWYTDNIIAFSDSEEGCVATINVLNNLEAGPIVTDMAVVPLADIDVNGMDESTIINHLRSGTILASLNPMQGGNI